MTLPNKSKLGIKDNILYTGPEGVLRWLHICDT